jgi:hypothetical protein
MLFWGLANVHVTQTVLAVGQRWMANLMMLWPHDKHQTMYAISLLNHVVVLLSTSEGSQKWFAPCGTDVHGVACTIDVCIVEQESHRQTKMIMWNGALRAQNMENLGAMSVCLLEQLRPLILAQTVVTNYCIQVSLRLHAFEVKHESSVQTSETGAYRYLSQVLPMCLQVLQQVDKG